MNFFFFERIVSNSTVMVTVKQSRQLSLAPFIHPPTFFETLLRKSAYVCTWYAYAGGAIGGPVPADFRDSARGLAGVRVVPVSSRRGQQVGACGQGAAGGVVQHAQVSKQDKPTPLLTFATRSRPDTF